MSFTSLGHCSFGGTGSPSPRLTWAKQLVLADEDTGERHRLQLRETLSRAIRHRQQLTQRQYLAVDEAATLARCAFRRPASQPSTQPLITITIMGYNHRVRNKNAILYYRVSGYGRWAPTTSDPFVNIKIPSRSCKYTEVDFLSRIAVQRYVDAAYCYRPTSVVCLSVYLSH